MVGDGVVIGDDCHVYPGATLYAGTQLRDRVRVHAGARLGSDGFGYVFRDGAHAKIPHVGRCIVESDVEIGANTTIDRGSIDDTVIGAGTKIDNLVQVGHNVRIGRLCLLMSQVGIAGSVRIEDGCILAGQVGIAGHVRSGAGRIAAQAGVFGFGSRRRDLVGLSGAATSRGTACAGGDVQAAVTHPGARAVDSEGAGRQALMRRTIGRAATVHRTWSAPRCLRARWSSVPLSSGRG